MITVERADHASRQRILAAAKTDATQLAVLAIATLQYGWKGLVGAWVGMFIASVAYHRLGVYLYEREREKVKTQFLRFGK